MNMVDIGQLPWNKTKDQPGFLDGTVDGNNQLCWWQQSNIEAYAVKSGQLDISIKAVSVVWQALKPDWKLLKVLLLLIKWIKLSWINFLKQKKKKRSFKNWAVLNILSDRASHLDLFSNGWMTACLKKGTLLEVRELLIIKRIKWPTEGIFC